MTVDELLVAWEVVVPIREAWRNILRRCEDTQYREYERWGGRGIKVHEPWHEFRQFLADILSEIGPRPPGVYERSGWPRYSLDRIDNDGNYEPGNVRWADGFTQAGNRRCTRRLEIAPGQRFGRLTVISESHEVIPGAKPLPSGASRKQRVVTARCDCGEVTTVSLSNLVKKAGLANRSCGPRCAQLARYAKAR